ncbi:hypothetical protein F503_00192 [Ophiostoma piceae UAMH 11346]|uniref:Alb1-domain-containing protein n=1 Tax=Ophiostoma piceae (strain UAMH 11346) TaxID=1262450 RepID=S3CFE6_OPHP1|nr:hypothetical protein F503_00192 [Ophiostoma piceae UAMH 11346]
MAKKGPSKHSRAARRATSPGIDTDKSLKDIKAPTKSANERHSILGIHQSAGVTKKQKKTGRSLSARARKRQEKGLDRAAAIIERTATKVERSKSQSRVIQSRSKEWTEINRAAKEADIQATKKLGMFGALAGGDDTNDEDDDDDVEDADSGDEAVRKFYDNGLDESMGEAAPIAAAVPLAALATNDEDIL